MAAITVLTEYSNPADNQSFAVKGIKAVTQVYAATSIPLFTTAKEQHFCYAQLTGAMTINAATVLTGFRQFDIVHFHFSSDASIRVITFGTGFASAGTLSTVASKDATATFIFDGVALKEMSRSIGA